MSEPASRNDIAVAQAAIDAWPATAPPSIVTSDACRRLLDAMATLGTVRTGWRDIAGLARQVLLTGAATFGGWPCFDVPAGSTWPGAADWDAVHCSATALADGRLRVRALGWAPPATPAGSEVGAEAALEQVLAAYRDVDPDEKHPVPADPFWWAAHEYDHYRGESQRQAARAAVLSDRGSIVVALPTGRGKTAVAWSRPLLSDRGVTVVVVPTVVLALDMERRTAEVSRKRTVPLSPVAKFAYIGSLDAEAKRELRDAMRAGTQRLLYTSPEAFVSGLAPALIDCARDGLLQQIVIDEAHLVDQWGTDFRPEFQTMPGLITDAYDLAPGDRKPSVLLMSATLAQRPIDLLTRLFSFGISTADLVWGSEVRVEPAYYLAAHDDDESRTAAVLEAVSCLPRPLVLYTTKVEDAKTWVTRLVNHGLSRVAAVTGDSSDDHRRTVLERWRGMTAAGKDIPISLDVIVGTSAFGLGVDMPNVRTVVHACIPESIDRYYQEVGRAGRDGRPSIAYLCSGPGDGAIAARLSEITMIGDELGWKRWRSLLDRADDGGDLRSRVRKSTLPTYMTEGYGRSAKWNVRTLTLMAQAGIIRLRVPRWNAKLNMSEEEQEQARATFYENVSDFIEFELLNGEYQGHEGWIQALSRVRTDVRTAQKSALQSLLLLVEGERCVGRQIARHYQVSRGGATLRTVAACRGCPACRRSPTEAPGIAVVEPSPTLPSTIQGKDPLATWRGDSPTLFIWHDDPDAVGPVLRRLAQRGVSAYAGIDPETANRLQRAVRATPIVLDDLTASVRLVDTYAGPMTIVLSGHRAVEALATRMAIGLASYAIGEASTPNPTKPGWFLRDTLPSIAASDLLKEI